MSVYQYYQFNKWWLEYDAFHGNYKRSTHQCFPGWTETEVAELRNYLATSSALGLFCCLRAVEVQS